MNDGPGYIYIGNTETGEIHRLDLGGRSLETCNIDAIRKAGHDEELNEEMALACVVGEPDRRCAHCWPSEEPEVDAPSTN